MTDVEADQVWSALSDVGKALRKAGHQKPQRKRASVVDDAAGQADLPPLSL